MRRVVNAFGTGVLVRALKVVNRDVWLLSKHFLGLGESKVPVVEPVGMVSLIRNRIRGWPTNSYFMRLRGSFHA